MERGKTCCVTGHRPEKLPWGFDEADARCVELKDRLRAAVERAYDDGFRHFITGMARGTDQYFAQIVLELRNKRPGVTLEAAIPCEEQASRSLSRQREACSSQGMAASRVTPGRSLRRSSTIRAKY